MNFKLSRPGLKQEEEPRTYNFVIVIRLVLRRVCAGALWRLRDAHSYTCDNTAIQITVLHIPL